MHKNIKYLNLLLLCSFISVIFFVSCRQDVKTTYEDRLTGHIWMLNDYQIEQSPVVSIYSSLDTCVKDNLYRFFLDGTYTTYEGIKKCSPNDPIEQRGTWSFSSDRKVLTTIDYKGERTNLDILTMEKETMKFRYTDTSSINYLEIYKPKP